MVCFIVFFFHRKLPCLLLFFTVCAADSTDVEWIASKCEIDCCYFLSVWMKMEQITSYKRMGWFENILYQPSTTVCLGEPYFCRRFACVAEHYHWTLGSDSNYLRDLICTYFSQSLPLWKTILNQIPINNK